MKKSGIELISEERREQIEKHGKTVEFDVKQNKNSELSFAAALLCCPNPKDYSSAENDYGCPEGWNKTQWVHMINKPYKERLIIVGSFAAAEIDRLNAFEEKP